MLIDLENVNLWTASMEANQLIEQGIKLLNDPREGGLPERQQALFSVLSNGVEKYLKISLGLIELKGNQKWLTKKEYKKIGHGIAEMNQRLTDYICTNLSTADRPEYIKKALSLIPDMQVMELIFGTLDRYADKEGRFFSIDSLAGSPQPGKSPDELWIEVENKVTELNPQIKPTVSENVDSMSYEIQLGSAIAQYFIAWQRLIAYSAMQGLFGDKGRLFGNYIEVTDFLP
jgi:hypothetical protein